MAAREKETFVRCNASIVEGFQAGLCPRSTSKPGDRIAYEANAMIDVNEEFAVSTE